MSLQFRRGLNSDRTSITPMDGEPIWATDTQALYIGDGATAGGIHIVGAGAPANAEFLVKTADATLSAERVVTDSTSIVANWATAGQVEFRREALTGDVTASANSNATTIANDAVTYAKMQNVSATDRLLGRQSSGAGDVEEITCTAAGRALIDDADAAAQRTTLGLVAAGAGDIWVEKAGDTMTGTLTSTIASTGSARCITASGTSTNTTGFPILANWTHTGAPASNSTAQIQAFQFETFNNCGTGITSQNWYAFSATGMRFGANADGNISEVRGAQITGCLMDASSVATAGTMTNSSGLVVFGARREGAAGNIATITSVTGVSVQTVGTAGYTVTTARGVRVQNSGTGNTITINVGVDIDSQSAGSTTNVGLRVAAPSGGTTTAAVQLSGTTGAASGILFATDTNLYRSAANVLKTDDTFEAANVSGTNTGDQLTYATFTAAQNAPPASAAATAGTRNSIPVLAFDADTDESAVFIGIMPQGAKLASGLKVRIHWTAATATSGAVAWEASFERLVTDIDSDSFAAGFTVSTTTNGTSGVPNVTEITITTIDSIVAGDAFRLKITRDANDAILDTMLGDAQVIAVEVRSAV